MTYTATYSPEDNKLRLYASERLDAETYAKVKKAGFSWAPQQKLFYAPMWTPQREDLCIELAGEIGDEDTTLVDRAEERAERFEEYGENRKADADRAHAAVESIANGIPLGQPILVGHHSERHARRDAEKIENGMRKAVKMWETSKYWERRAAGALAHAKYKELPTVRARRIKGLVADLRRCEAAFTPKGGEVMQPRWNDGAPDAKRIPHVLTGQGRAQHYTPVEDLPRIKAGYMRWMAHYHNRIIYETAMLNEQGAGALIAKKARPKQLPLLNYKADSLVVNVWGRDETYKVLPMTSEQFKGIYDDYRGTATAKGTHRVRIALIKVDDSGAYVPCKFPPHSQSKRVVVFLTDSKTHTPPDGEVVAAPKPRREFVPYTPTPKSEEETKFEALKDTLKAGVKVVSTPQLFPTPPELAEQLVELAEIEPGTAVLEPSAGTGNLLRAIRQAASVAIKAVEINYQLAEGLRASKLADDVICRDFLEMTPEADGTFDRVVMNPPFVNGADIEHIIHAMAFLNPGGRLVAICANGPRQREKLQTIADHWVDLPADSFKSSGTGVNAAIFIYTKGE